MTSSLMGREGGWSKCDNSTDRLHEWDSDKGGGGPKIPHFCGRHICERPFKADRSARALEMRKEGHHSNKSFPEERESWEVTH